MSQPKGSCSEPKSKTSWPSVLELVKCRWPGRDTDVPQEPSCQTTPSLKEQEETRHSRKRKREKLLSFQRVKSICILHNLTFQLCLRSNGPPSLTNVVISFQFYLFYNLQKNISIQDSNLERWIASEVLLTIFLRPESIL